MNKYQQKFRFKDQREMFGHVWASRPHVSEVSGRRLHEGRAHNFAHILPKGTYPAFKLNPDNIALMTLSEHTEFDNGVRDNEWQDKFAEILRRREILKEQYRELTEPFYKKNQ